MSITDELREWAHGFTDLYVSNERQLLAIADRIDEQHEKVRDKAYNEGVYDGIDADKNAMGYIKLPVDADGVPIEIGDYLHCDETGKDFPCRGYCCSVGKDGERRWTVECSYDSYNGTSEFVSARRCHHHREQTVEDVLREFAEKMNENIGMYTGEAIDADEWRDADRQTIAEYAAKLRLAGEVE